MIDVPSKLQEFINESRAPLPPVTDLDEPLHIDSMVLMRLVAYLEIELNFRVDDEDLIAENFLTLRAICELMDPTKQQAHLFPLNSSASPGPLFRKELLVPLDEGHTVFLAPPREVTAQGR